VDGTHKRLIGRVGSSDAYSPPIVPARRHPNKKIKPEIEDSIWDYKGYHSIKDIRRYNWGLMVP